MAKATFLICIKLSLLLAWYFISSAAAAKFAAAYIGLPPQEISADLMQRVFLVAFLEVGTLSWLASSLGTNRLRAIVIVFCFYHVTKHALMLIEALFYLNLWNKPALLSVTEIVGLEIMGLLSSVTLCVVVVLLFSQRRLAEKKPRRLPAPSWRFLLTASIIYTLCYYLAGALILIPLAGDSFAKSYQNLQVPIWMPLLQIARGLVWVFIISVCLNGLVKMGLGHSTMLISSCLVVFSTAQLLIPNSQMPDALQSAHIIELVISMSVFGSLATFIWFRGKPDMQN